ncbi:sensor histidine kinase [Thalassomonas actiniarum]|uniref:histidine kinase n=1 Tax=Thalassomonas actiniarum TaxID=485447 RepID=A0AAF0C4J6_9GAMM|nr:HAMP domain-containing sensor histidine kinase [Thalassomonas actiniarum]WDE02367.1 HAMP domain-containing histidine kinase [Thalassomonas actiniarum]
MTKSKDKTLEGFITFWLTLFFSFFLIPVFSFMWYLELWAWEFVLVTSLMAFGYIVAIIRFRNRIILSFHRALLHIESIRQEDYKQFAKPVFPKGTAGKFHLQLKNLSKDLSEKKQRYDQHAFLVYQLIDQLETPVMVFNQKDQLTYANGAFSHLYETQPWQRYRYASSKLLGVIKTENGWQLQHKTQQQWQISQSTFIDAGRAHQLLIFTNIESAVRSSQVKAWQQMISVMGHEIRNSLTPVSTIAGNLSTRTENMRDKEALALISERCSLLQDFINRYASLTKQINLNYEEISVVQLAERIKRLFTQVELKVVIKSKSIWVDKSIMEQVLINLVKNAHEAGAHNITLDFREDNNNTTIRAIDDGHGFANLENLFVPLFTTKQEGQGIGLSFCRNIIEQHQGSINLVNNCTKGVTVTITLPLKTPKVR